MSLLSVQPFGVASAGGGPRILRALLADPPMPTVAVCCSPQPPPPAEGVDEAWLRDRPHLGRIEATRYGAAAALLTWPWRPALEARLSALARRHGARVVHAVAHTSGFAAAQRIAHREGLPFLLSVHDDLRYLLTGHPDRAIVLRGLGRAWREAHARFVISDALGDEYGRRFGQRGYVVVTDGVEDRHIRSEPWRSDRTRIYFAGLFHRSYARGFQSLLDALSDARHAGGGDASVVCRCGTLPDGLRSDGVPLELRPFGSEEQVRQDIAGADLLYLPLPFGAEHRDFVRWSLSTKLITYLASGRPILYHGPPEGAAHDLLAGAGAAILVTSPDAPALARALELGVDDRRAIAARALDLVRCRFRLADQRRRFWDEVVRAGGG